MSEKPITLEEVTRLWGRGAAQRIAEDLMRPNPLLERLERNMPKPTRWHKFIGPWLRRWRQMRDAWDVLLGHKEARDSFDDD